MKLPKPHPGLVIRYAYLWKREADAGHEEGSKDRPCAVIMTITRSAGEEEVIVLPVTHSAPGDPADAIEIPPQTKKRLGLDFDRSWIVIAEANVFLWPGPDLRFVTSRGEETVAYGVLPPDFFAHVRDKYLERYAREKRLPVRRTE